MCVDEQGVLLSFITNNNGKEGKVYLRGVVRVVFRGNFYRKQKIIYTTPVKQFPSVRHSLMHTITH